MVMVMVKVMVMVMVMVMGTDGQRASISAENKLPWQMQTCSGSTKMATVDDSAELHAVASLTLC